MLPVASLYVQVMVVVDVKGKAVSVVAVIVPSQLSVAVGAVKEVIYEQSSSVGKSAAAGTGSVVSSIVACCVCVAVLSAPSVYVHVMVIFMVIGGVTSVVAVMVPSQLPVAVGAVREVICEQSSNVGKSATIGTGSVVSAMVTCCVCVAVLSAPSVYVHVMVVSEVMGKLEMLLVTLTVPG